MEGGCAMDTSSRKLDHFKEGRPAINSNQSPPSINRAKGHQQGPKSETTMGQELLSCKDCAKLGGTRLRTKGTGCVAVDSVPELWPPPYGES